MTKGGCVIWILVIACIIWIVSMLAAAGTFGTEQAQHQDLKVLWVVPIESYNRGAASGSCSSFPAGRALVVSTMRRSARPLITVGIRPRSRQHLPVGDVPWADAQPQRRSVLFARERSVRAAARAAMPDTIRAGYRGPSHQDFGPLGTSRLACL